MPHARLNDDEIALLGEQIYQRDLRSQVENRENIGKLISIDVETGAYEIGGDADVEAPLRLHARHSDAAIYTIRIGYNAAVSLGGVMERTV